MPCLNTPNAYLPAPPKDSQNAHEYVRGQAFILEFSEAAPEGESGALRIVQVRAIWLSRGPSLILDPDYSAPSFASSVVAFSLSGLNSSDLL